MKLVGPFRNPGRDPGRCFRIILAPLSIRSSRNAGRWARSSNSPGMGIEWGSGFGNLLSAITELQAGPRGSIVSERMGRRTGKGEVLRDVANYVNFCDTRAGRAGLSRTERRPRRGGGAGRPT